MARKKKVSQDAIKADGWLATYADTITLLLTFFVLLYSMATIDNEKIKQLSTAFRTFMSGEEGATLMQYDLYDGEVPLIGGETSDPVQGGEGITEQEKIYNDIKNFVESNNLSEVVEIIDDERGVAMQLKSNILFETSSSNLKEDSKIILKKINSIISSLENPILVEGHTDNRPINTDRFPSNWELSADRAVNVVRYFVEVLGEDPERFSATGYAEFKPVAPNNNYENMAKNRRVDILIVTSEKEAS